jgi:MFS family permease
MAATVPVSTTAAATPDGRVGDGRTAHAPGGEGQAAGADRIRSHGFASVLRNKYFLRLWMAQLISQTIMNATNYGLLTLITSEHKSLLATGGAIVAFSLPALLFGAPAGVVVDRFDRRTVLWVSNGLRGVATVVFVVSLMIDPSALIPVYLLTFFIAVVGQFFAPAEGAAIPRLVHPRELINALALFNITFTMSQAAGLIVLGPLVLLLVPQWSIGSLAVPPIVSLLILIAVLYGICALLILSIPKERLKSLRAGDSGPRPKLAQERRQLVGILHGVIDAWNFIRRDVRLSVAVWQLSLAGVVTSVIAMIAPAFVNVFFKAKPEAAALVFVPAGIGLVVGSAFMPRILRRLGYGLTVWIGIVALALCTSLLPLVLALAPWLFHGNWWHAWPYIGAVLSLTLLMGFALDFINVPAQHMMQERAPDWIKGRVLAVQIMLFNAVAIPTVLVIGLTGDRYGLPVAMDVLAIGIALFGTLTMLFWTRAQFRDAHRAHVGWQDGFEDGHGDAMAD